MGYDCIFLTSSFGLMVLLPLIIGMLMDIVVHLKSPSSYFLTTTRLLGGVARPSCSSISFSFTALQCLVVSLLGVIHLDILLHPIIPREILDPLVIGMLMAIMVHLKCPSSSFLSTTRLIGGVARSTCSSISFSFTRLQCLVISLPRVIHLAIFLHPIVPRVILDPMALTLEVIYQ